MLSSSLLTQSVNWDILFHLSEPHFIINKIETVTKQVCSDPSINSQNEIMYESAL